jgi:hypothetical protein
MAFLLWEKNHKLMSRTCTHSGREEVNGEEQKPAAGKQNHFVCTKWKKINKKLLPLTKD